MLSILRGKSQEEEVKTAEEALAILERGWTLVAKEIVWPERKQFFQSSQPENGVTFREQALEPIPRIVYDCCSAKTDGVWRMICIVVCGRSDRLCADIARRERDRAGEGGVYKRQVSFCGLGRVGEGGKDRQWRGSAEGEYFHQLWVIRVGWLVSPGWFPCPSLLSLGNVINALSDERRKKDLPLRDPKSATFVPYRDSKLTRVLQVSVQIFHPNISSKYFVSTKKIFSKCWGTNGKNVLKNRGWNLNVIF